MTADKAREIVYKVKSENESYFSIIDKIKILAENGHSRLITDYPGWLVISRLINDGYMVFDGAMVNSQQCVISW